MTNDAPPKRMQGEKFADFQERQRTWSKARAKPQGKAKKARQRRDKVADRIDGYDRDDLGLSPDF